MSEQNRTRIEEVDWVSVFPFSRIFRSFRIAVHPPKLLIALVLVMGLYLVGLGMDQIWGERVVTRVDPVTGQVMQTEYDAYVAGLQTDRGGRAALREFVDAQMDALGNQLASASLELSDDKKEALREEPTESRIREALDRYRDAVRTEAAKKIEEEKDEAKARLLERRRDERLAWADSHFTGIFATIVQAERQSFALIPAAIRELDVLAAGQAMVEVFKTTFYHVPGWLFADHWFFAVVYLLVFLGLFSLLGGAISRMIALQATREEQVSTIEAMNFARSRFIWFFLSPLIPVVLILFIGLLISIGGLLYNWPVADVFAALLYFVALIGGFIIAVLVIGLAAGGGLLFPAVAVEGTESFDAISRAFNYVLGRPWRWLFYSLVAVIYSAIVLGFVVIVVSLTLEGTAYFAGMWVWNSDGGDMSRFTAIAGRSDVQWENLNDIGDVAASIVRAWVFVVRMFIPAFFISLFLTTNTWVYLLLRRSADGTEYDDVYVEADEEEWDNSPTPDKVEPASEPGSDEQEN